MFNAKIITIGSQTFLGTVAYDDGRVILSNFMPVDSPNVTVNDCAEFLKADHAKNLSPELIVTGTAAVVSECDLNADLKDEVAILEARFAKAVKTALPNLVNAAFDRIR